MEHDWIKLLVTFGGWAFGALAVSWTLSRRTQGWDKGEKAHEDTRGNEDSKDPKEQAGLKRRMTQAEESITSLTKIVKGLVDALEAHGGKVSLPGSSDSIVAAKARQSIMDQAHEAVSRNRQLIIAEFESRISPVPQGDEVYVEVEEQPKRKLGSGKLPFNPEDTGQHRARKPR